MTIRLFRNEHYFLSNFYPAKIEYGSLTFPTSEHLFQARKTEDYNWQIKISEAESPSAAKRLGREAPLRADWEHTKYTVMRLVLDLKFSPNPELRDALLSTNDEYLIEGNDWHDQTWGDCHCEKHRAIRGRNALGILLMDLRLSLLEAKGAL